jgi:phosphate starvation-inducible PhoH-like protein
MTRLDAPAAAAPEALHLEFDDNALLSLLFGEYDENLARIEQELDVSLASRGNRVAISGSTGDAEIARDVLRSLYDRLKRGQSVGPADIDAAMRMAQAGLAVSGGDGAGDVHIHTRKRRIEPRSPTQAVYIRAMQEHELVFGLGPSGTGKTYLAVATAVSMLLSGQVDRLILSRPAVEAGERLGFLPGDLREKVDPYLRPLYDALYDTMLGEQVVRRHADPDEDVSYPAWGEFAHGGDRRYKPDLFARRGALRAAGRFRNTGRRAGGRFRPVQCPRRRTPQPSDPDRPGL